MNVPLIISILIKEFLRGQDNIILIYNIYIYKIKEFEEIQGFILWDPIYIYIIIKNINKGMLLGIPKNDCIWDFIQNIISFSYKITY